MSILNRPSDGLLSVLLALRRALIAYGPQTEARLLKLCAPPSVVPDGKPDMARKTLTRWKQLGFFQERGGTIHFAADVAGIAADEVDSLRAVVLRLVLKPENNPALTADPDEDAENNRASDCTRAMAWALSQDAFSFQAIVGHRAVETLENEQDVAPRLFTNDTRWPGFKEWAVFLGVAWATSKGIVVDPAFAVRSVLPELFGAELELAEEAFFDRLALLLPIIDNGSYRRVVEGQVARPWRAGRANQVSVCLSLALLGLAASGHIRIEARSDAKQRMLLGRGGRESRPVSHVSRGSTP